MKNILQSKGVYAVLWILGALVVLLLVFGAGVAVGYRSGLFPPALERIIIITFSAPVRDPDPAVLLGLG